MYTGVPMVNQTIKEKIRQRRAQMLVHSRIYYEMDENLVDDYTWQRWADELAVLQNENPADCNIGFYDSEFEGWNGSSGAFLPLKEYWVVSKTQHILDICRNKDVQSEDTVIQYNGTLEDFM
jgi:hypothetical protein